MSTNIDSLVSNQSDSALVAQRNFMQRIYAWMMGGLLLTGAIAYASLSNESLAMFAQSNFLLLVLAELGLVMWLSAGIQRMSVRTAQISFLVYSAINGLTLAMVLYRYTGESVTSTFVIAATMFGVMSIYGALTKRDLSSIGSFFFMGVIGIIIASVVNIFLQSSALSFAISIIGVVAFVALTAWDTQKLKDAYLVEEQDAALGSKVAILGALTLYLDFVNLFLFLLRLLGRRR